MYFLKVMPILFILIYGHRIHYNCNNKRDCQDDDYAEAWQRGYLQHRYMLVFLIVFCILLILVLLGIIKGLMGLFCWPPVGMWGLGALIDLPRPLDQYQEEAIAHRTVKYDIVGWPVHPDTGERSVRALTKKTEFCLNTIFFLTYPLALINILFSLCCFKTSETIQEDECYTSVNRILLCECPKYKKNKNVVGPVLDMYDDEDPAEEEDTHYVIQQMQRSHESLINGH